MSDTLLIHYNIDDANQATWSLCNDAGELTGKTTSGSLDDLTELASKHKAVVLLNSQCLHINQLQLPTQNMQKMLKAVPYAIEEFIAEDIEEFHFVVSKNKNSDATSVVGIDKSTLENILQRFQSANINVEKIIPDALCLPTNETQWACLNYQNTSYLQTGRLSGMVFSNDVLPYIIKSKLEDEAITAPEKFLLFCEQESSSVFAELDINSMADGGEIEVINVVYNKHPLAVFCGQYKQASALNLLQHKFKPGRKSSAHWQHWRLAASLALIWLVLHLGFTGFRYSQLKNENTITKAKIEKIYKKAFPQSRKIVNPRVQMEQKLKELKSNAGGGSNGLIFLLAESFGTLSHDKQNITLQSLTFRNNKIDIGLDSTNLQAVENLNNSLNNNTNIKAEITSSTSEKNKVKGNIRIEGRS